MLSDDHSYARPADVILHGGRIATQDPRRPFAQAVAIRDGHLPAPASRARCSRARRSPRMIDLGGRTAIPGLNDSHIHLIRGGLNFNLELRWDGVPSLADGLRMLRNHGPAPPAPRWVRVVGGWSEFQFAERRMPTLDEINAAAPDTPVFVLHLYARALLNRAALAACGYTRDTPDPPGGEVQRDKAGNPTGLLIARPNALILYASWPRARSCRRSTRRIRRSASCASSTGWGSPASSTPAAASRTTPRTTGSSTSCTATAR